MIEVMVWAIILILFLFVLLSPLESLRWWSDKGEREVQATFDVVPSEVDEEHVSHRFVVYLSGVGVVGGDQLSNRELAWLDTLDDQLSDVCVVADVFPYSVDNRGLLQRATMRVWCFIDRSRRQWRSNPINYLINVRNIAQVLVSADQRYGPTQSIGLAQELWRSLQRHGYAPGSGDPVYLVGFSGGAQMALGAGWFLSGLGVPTSLISIGGIFSDGPGLDRMERVWDIRGSRDRMRWLGYVFPGRWATAPLSSWGKARHEGRVTARTIGPMKHEGPEGYFGRRATNEHGRAFADLTREEVVGILALESRRY